MKFKKVVGVVSVLATLAQTSMTVARIFPDGVLSDEQTSIVYWPESGELAVDGPVNHSLTSINIDSASGIFTEQPARNLGGRFDNDGDVNIFKATFGRAFDSLSFGNVAVAGLDEAFVLNDLSIIGSRAEGGSLDNVVFSRFVAVPEPCGILMAGFGVFGVGAVAATQVRRNRAVVPPRIV